MKVLRVNTYSDICLNEEDIGSLINRVMTFRNIIEYSVDLIEVDDNQIADLNQRFRGIIGTTDVLSFVIEDNPLEGEIYINTAQARRSADKYGVKYADEIKKLIVHSALHLTNMLHDSENDIEIMESLTNELLSSG
ncbi:rRNA maturation RNase YbeY [bacterium]|nr:rRNA maturation RNase YbeY [bacterium]